MKGNGFVNLWKEVDFNNVKEQSQQVSLKFASKLLKSKFSARTISGNMGPHYLRDKKMASAMSKGKKKKIFF